METLTILNTVAPGEDVRPAVAGQSNRVAPAGALGVTNTRHSMG
jgi:hypothetical protein